MRGVMQRTKVDTLRTLLGRDGHNADSDGEVSAALQALDGREWERPLPLVQVAYAHAGPVCIGVVMPAGTGLLEWHVALEDGGEMRGRAELAHLPLSGRQEWAGQALESRTLAIEAPLPWGYHRFSVQSSDAEMVLVVTPGRCWLPLAASENRKLWGVAAQMYLLRSARNWGIGDDGDLRQLVKMLTACGADVFGLNPLHAMFLDEPEHASPYSPASRLLLTSSTSMLQPCRS